MYIKNLYNVCTHNKIIINEKNVLKRLKILLSIKWIIDGKNNSIFLNTGGGIQLCDDSHNRK